MEKPAKTKPKPPPYPRPVPEIFAEELPPAPADIAWQANESGDDWGEVGGGDGAEAQAQKRAAKRRRIEASARAYLRGEPLYIMSAQLKGPFKPGWKNPWSKKRRVAKTDVAGESRSLEIPETTKKTSTRAEEDTTERMVIAETEQQTISRGSKVQDVEHKVPSIRHPPSPFVDVATKTPKSPIDPGAKVPAKTKEKRVEEWLRRNESFAKKSEIQVLSSPTPVSKTHETPKQSQVADLAFRTSQSEPIVRPELLSRELEQAPSAGLNHARRLSDVVGHVQKLSRDIQDVLNEPTASSSAALLDEVRRLANPISKSKLDSSRAEFAILKARRGLQQMASVAARSSASEFRSTRAEGGSQSKLTLESDDLGGEPPETTSGNGLEKVAAMPETSKPDRSRESVLGPGVNYSEADADNEVQFSTAPQQRSGKILGSAKTANEESIIASDQYGKNTGDALATAQSAPRPALSIAISDISTADLLPSAQPRLEPQHSTSSVIKDEKLHSIKHVVSASEPIRNKENGENQEDQWALGETSNTRASNQLAAVVEQSKSVAPEFQDSVPDTTSNMAKANVQGLPFGFEPVYVSTTKTPKVPEKKETANTGPKAKTDKKRKKTSFVVEPSPISSHGSIQDVMKAKVSKKLDSPPLFLLGKDNLDIEVSDEEEESARKRSRRSRDGKPKSILKSTNPTSSPTALRRSKYALSTGQEQNVHNANGSTINSGQNAVDEDNFDLDGAIDDLGSFLGTWDAEKEASGLNIGI